MKMINPDTLRLSVRSVSGYLSLFEQEWRKCAKIRGSPFSLCIRRLFLSELFAFLSRIANATDRLHASQRTLEPGRGPRIANDPTLVASTVGTSIQKMEPWMDMGKYGKLPDVSSKLCRYLIDRLRSRKQFVMNVVFELFKFSVISMALM